MSVLDRNPTSVNFLNVSGFRLILKRAPNLNFAVQECAIPSISGSPVDTGNMFVNVPKTADHLSYAPFSCMFKLQEDLGDYMEIYRWITGTGYPENHEQYKKLSDQPPSSSLGIHSDITLLVLNSSSQASFEVTFFDAFPVDLGEIEFLTTLPDVRYATCTASFAYSHFTVRGLLDCQ